MPLIGVCRNPTRLSLAIGQGGDPVSRLHSNFDTIRGNADDLYAQEWAWFAIALYADALPNLWTNPTGR